MLQFYVKDWNNSVFKHAKCVETFVGGGHSQNSCALMAIMLIRHTENLKDARWLEVKLGDISKLKDTIECLNPLLKEHILV